MFVFLKKMNVKSTKIRSKLLALLMIPILALIVTTVIMVVNMNILTANKTEIHSSSSLVLNADRDMYQALVSVYSLLTLDDKQSDEYKDLLESFNENVDQVNTRVLNVKELMANIKELQSYRHGASGQTLVESIEQFQGAFSEWIVLVNPLIENQAEFERESAFLKTDESFNSARSYLNIAGEIVDEYSGNRIAEDDELKQSSIVYISAGVTIAVLLVIGLGLFFINRITSPIYKLQGIMSRAEAGDLTVIGDYDAKDEIGQLNRSFNGMLASFKDTVAKILTAAGSVSAAAQQISASTEEIASSSTEQAKSAQTMNELFAELSTAINSVADSADHASELSNKTMEMAKEGGAVVDSSIRGMDLLNRQMTKLEGDSNKIGEIIEVIDDIAEQTNLLALNAAIEAARAGDQGRGFAVVADEVRKLAERSGEATKQITSIIKGMQANTLESVKAVQDGVASSQKTGESFENIMMMVNESGFKVAEIAAASGQQAAQSSEVLQSIETISAATEETASGSEEAAASAQSLAQLAEELDATVSVFKIR